MYLLKAFGGLMKKKGFLVFPLGKGVSVSMPASLSVAMRSQQLYIYD